MDFVRLARGLKNQQSVLVPTTENIYKRVKGQLDRDWYTSIFRYNDKHLEIFRRTNSVAGMHGLKTNKIVFDFDAQEISSAKKDALTACARLVQNGVPEDQIRIFFSGGKGFHLECIFKTSLSQQEFVNIVFGVAADLPTFDQRIHDEARIFRLPLSRHPKTNLHKIPLQLDELASLSVEEIQALAKSNADYDENLLDEALFEIDIPDKLNVLKSKAFKKVGRVEMTEIKGFDIQDIDLSKCPKWLDPARWILSQGFFYGSSSVDKGERNSAFLILAATYRNQGFTPEHTLGLLVATAEMQARRTGEEPYTEEQLKTEIINCVFAPSWKGGIFGRDEELLVTTRKRFNLTDRLVETESVGIADVGAGFKEFAKNIDKNRIYTGLKSLDDAVVMTSGMLVSLLAAPGAGKTSLANSFVETLTINGENSLFFSLDMYKSLLFNRLLQKYTGYDFQKILEMYKNDEPDETLMKAYADVLQNYSKVAFNFKSGISIDELEDEVKTHIELQGKTPKLIVVDYLEKIRTPFSDATASSSYTAGRLADIAKKYDTTVLLLVQPSKVGGGDPRDEFKNYRAIKGSSSIESESRVILGLHRPGYNPADDSEDNFSCISILKNNTGRTGRFDYRWNGVAGTLTELDSEGKRDLAKLREDLAQRAVHRDDI